MSEFWRQSLSACWTSVQLQLPSLSEGIQESLSQLGHTLGQRLGLTSSSAGGVAAGQEYELRGRRLKVVRQLGEGGYSFVYLVRQVQGSVGGSSGGPSTQHAGGPLAAAPAATGVDGQLFALKRVLCGSEEQLREAEREVAVMRRLRHPCLLPLVDAATQLQRAPDGTTRHVVLMLFPVYDGGNLYDYVQQRRAHWERERRGAPAPARRAARRAELAELLRIFAQICAALHTMHSQEPALAHRDIKPQNVLLRPRRQAERTQHGSGSSGGGAAVGSTVHSVPYDPMPPLEQQQESQAAQGSNSPDEGWAEGAWSSGGGLGGGGEAAAAAAAAYAAAGALGGAAAGEGAQGRHRQEEEWWEARLGGWQTEHEAVLMDFGSTKPAAVEVRSRREAMAVQEDAERQCTAPYRAPELWDVPSHCDIDERVDVWSLGALLYYCVCGESPFERAAGEAGGSLMLAVVNGRFSWSANAGDLPESIKALVGRCLDTDPATRPRVADVAHAADRILSSLLL